MPETMTTRCPSWVRTRQRSLTISACPVSDIPGKRFPCRSFDAMSKNIPPSEKADRFGSAPGGWPSRRKGCSAGHHDQHTQQKFTLRKPAAVPNRPRRKIPPPIVQGHFGGYPDRRKKRTGLGPHPARATNNDFCRNWPFAQSLCQEFWSQAARLSIPTAPARPELPILPGCTTAGAR